MGLIGIFKGVGKVISGVVEEDAAKVVKGAAQTGISVITTLVSAVNGDSEEVVDNETDDMFDDEE